MKQELIDLYDKATDIQKEFIDCILKGHPVMGAVGKKERVEVDHDILYAINGELGDINLLRACLISADISLNNDNAFQASIFVFSLILKGRGFTADWLKDQVFKIIEEVDKNFGDSERKLH